MLHPRLAARKQAAAPLAFLILIVVACAKAHPAELRPASAIGAPASASPTTAPLPAPSRTLVAETAIAKPKEEPKVLARWIVHEQVGEGSRYLLVQGHVLRGAEEDPPAEADYVVLRKIDRAEATASRLPVRTMKLPRFYTLPEPFTLALTLETEPAGGRIFEVQVGGALKPRGESPVAITLTGHVSDRAVVLSGAEWTRQAVKDGGMTMELWASGGGRVTSQDGAPITATLLDADDLKALRAGKTKLQKRIAIPLREPMTPNTEQRIRVLIRHEHVNP